MEDDEGGRTYPRGEGVASVTTGTPMLIASRLVVKPEYGNVSNTTVAAPSSAA